VGGEKSKAAENEAASGRERGLKDTASKPVSSSVAVAVTGGGSKDAGSKAGVSSAAGKGGSDLEKFLSTAKAKLPKADYSKFKASIKSLKVGCSTHWLPGFLSFFRFVCNASATGIFQSLLFRL